MKIENGIKIMIAELEAYEKSVIGYTNLGVGYTQEVMGEDRFVCKICGHCPGALKERLKQLLDAKESESRTKLRANT